jgi:hypothetical protein
MFLICSTPVNALPLGEVQGSVSDVDHVVNELRAKHFFAYKATVPLDQLKDNSIVQLVNKKGYIRYLVYDGLARTEDGEQIVLIDDMFQRFMTLENFKKSYTGITIIRSTSILSADMIKEIRCIQEKDLNNRLKSLKEHRNFLKHSITILSMSISSSTLISIMKCKKELVITEQQIKRVEDEMIYLGFIGA